MISSSWDLRCAVGISVRIPGRGDSYDVFEIGGGSFGVAIGDVCGKGPDAAAVTALARYTLRAHAVAALRPSFLLARLNELRPQSRFEQRRFRMNG